VSLHEDELRSLVRQSVARVLGQQALDETAGSRAGEPMDRHASHHRYALPEAGGPCLIEPTVPCNHCGYCQSHGH
jgi:hypothetical protein